MMEPPSHLLTLNVLLSHTFQYLEGSCKQMAKYRSVDFSGLINHNQVTSSFNSAAKIPSHNGSVESRNYQKWAAFACCFSKPSNSQKPLKTE